MAGKKFLHEQCQDKTETPGYNEFFEAVVYYEFAKQRGMI